MLLRNKKTKKTKNKNEKKKKRFRFGQKLMIENIAAMVKCPNASFRLKKSVIRDAQNFIQNIDIYRQTRFFPRFETCNHINRATMPNESNYEWDFVKKCARDQWHKNVAAKWKIHSKKMMKKKRTQNTNPNDQIRKNETVKEKDGEHAKAMM